MANEVSVYAKHAEGLIAIDRGALGLCLNTLDRMGLHELIRTMKRSFEEVYLIKGAIEDTINVYSFESNHLVAMRLQKALDELNSANKHEIHQAIVESCVIVKKTIDEKSQGVK